MCMTSAIFNSRLVYSKGALLLHMLRWKLGDEAFFEGILNYISDPELAYGYALTSDLQEHLEQVSGQDLDEFFADWLYGEGWPNYTVHWAYDPSCEKVFVRIEQSHSAGQGTFFEMPVPILFSNGVQDTVFVFDQNTPNQLEFYKHIDFEPTSVIFDPDKWLCAKKTVYTTTLPPRTIAWTGAVDSDWNNPDNWDCDVPTANDHAWIPGGTPVCTVQPLVTASCKSLLLDPAAELIIYKYGTLNISE